MRRRFTATRAISGVVGGDEVSGSAIPGDVEPLQSHRQGIGTARRSWGRKRNGRTRRITGRWPVAARMVSGWDRRSDTTPATFSTPATAPEVER